jgi:hypothetical protein
VATGFITFRMHGMKLAIRFGVLMLMLLALASML